MLIIALWALSLLAVFAVLLGAKVRQEMALIRRLDDRSNLRLIAEAGVRLGIAELEKEAENSYHTMSDMWSSNSQLFKSVDTGEGTFDICYDYVYDIHKGPVARYGLVDEERKININKADRIVLKRLFISALNMDDDTANALAASIIDWRDGDEELSAPLGSAESSYYRNLTYPYEAKNGSFEVLDELLLVRGVDRGIYEKIKNFVTVYGNGRVNVNTASKEVLMAVGLGEKMANDIIRYRMGEDKTPGTADDGIFDTPQGIVPKLSQYSDLSPSEVAIASTAADQHLGVNSSAFTIRSIARSKNGRAAYTDIAVVGKKGKVLYWQES